MRLLFDHAVDLLAQTFRGPAEVRFQHLTDVHARRHAERIQNDVDRLAVLVVRHVFDRHDHRDHTLVTVTAGHLVARLDATLDRQVHLDDLQHAGRQIVARGDLALLVFEALIEFLALQLQALGRLLERSLRFVFLHADLEPLLTRQLRQVFLRDLGALLQLPGPLRHSCRAAWLDTLVKSLFHDAVLVVEVLADAVELSLLDRQRARILLDSVAREHLHVDDRAFHARRHAQRRIFHVGCFLAEDRAQQFLFRRQLGLALRRHLAHQNVARTSLPRR